MENLMKTQQNGQEMDLVKVKPDQNDWYETVKVNYGVRPDSSKDFPELPAGFDQKSYKEHFDFWQDKDVPDSWKKFKSIALYWTAKGLMVSVTIWPKWFRTNFGVI